MSLLPYHKGNNFSQLLICTGHAHAFGGHGVDTVDSVGHDGIHAFLKASRPGSLIIGLGSTGHAGIVADGTIGVVSAFGTEFRGRVSGLGRSGSPCTGISCHTHFAYWTQAFRDLLIARLRGNGTGENNAQHNGADSGNTTTDNAIEYCHAVDPLE